MEKKFIEERKKKGKNNQNWIEQREKELKKKELKLKE